MRIGPEGRLAGSAADPVRMLDGRWGVGSGMGRGRARGVGAGAGSLTGVAPAFGNGPILKAPWGCFPQAFLKP